MPQMTNLHKITVLVVSEASLARGVFLSRWLQNRNLSPKHQHKEENEDKNKRQIKI